ncbi:PAS domain S-box protein [candidate division KSB1 bacterium]|nr:PAS domain S-box protein [candidate division KSB1 bacterium]
MPKSSQEKIDTIIEFISALARGDVSHRLQRIDEDSNENDLDAITEGLNMLAEELEALQGRTKERTEKLDEELETTQEYLDTIILQMPAGLAILEGPDFKYSRINQELAGINGLSVEEHLGRPLAEVLPQAAKDIVPVLQKVLDTGEATPRREFSTRLPKVPDEIRHFIDSFFPIKGPDGEVKAVGVVVLDIGERKEAEMLLARTNEELERRVKERTEELQKALQASEMARQALVKSEKIAQAQLTEIDQFYKTAPVGLCLLDRDLRYLRINQQLADINGKSISEHIGKTIHEVIPDIAKIITGIYLKVIDSGEPIINSEVKGFLPAQPEVPRNWLVSYYPLLSNKGLVQGVNTIVIDITERKQAEVALRESEQTLRQLVETTKILPWQADAQTWKFTYVGPQAEELLGYPSEQWYEKDFWAEHIHPEDREWTIDFCMKSAGLCKDYEFEYRMLAADGRIVWFHDLVSVVSENGKPKLLRGFMIDITERKRIEKAQKDSEEKFRALFTQARDGIVLADSETGLIVDCNQEFEVITGRNLGQLQEMKIWEIRPPDKMKIAKRDFFAIQEKGGADARELTIKKADGRVVPIEFTSSRINIGGKPYNQSIVRDITERKESERTIQRMEQLATLGELAANIAHEIRNPLASISLNVQYISDYWELPKTLVKKVENINLALLRTQDIIRETLEFARPSPPDLRQVNIHRVIESSIRSVTKEYEQAEIQIKKNFQAKVPQVLIDDNKILQVLINLLQNAKDASPKGGIVTIATRARTNELQVQIKDNGDGISAEKLDKIFEPFYSTKKTGFGLGLAIVARLVEQHGAHIDVKSRVGKGTEFTITFKRTL